MELGQQSGRYSRNKDIVAWARKKRRHIRREELLAFLCGKNPPVKNRLTSSSGGKRHNVSHERSMHRHSCSHSMTSADPVDVDLGTFQQAIALQGTNFESMLFSYSCTLTPKGWMTAITVAKQN